MRRIIHTLVCLSLALPLLTSLPAGAQSPAVAPAPATAPAASQPAAYAPGVVLIGLKPGHSVALEGLADSAGAALEVTLGQLGVRQVEPLLPLTSSSAPALAGASALGQIYRLRLLPSADVPAAVAVLQADPAVAFAEPDYVAHLITTPNDPEFAEQWALATINAPAAWNVVTGTPTVSIAVIDAGLDITHPELANQLWTNPGETPGNSLDDDNNGYVDDLHGANIYGQNADLTDTTGHGTQVAGIMAAQTNNALGVAGVCWQCRLMIVKVVQPGGIANYSDIAAGIAYAAQKGAQVINLSLGGLTDSATLRAAIAAAAPSAVIVAGAGNNNSAAPFYPAAYPEVVAVAGTTISDTKVSTSNYGSWVDLTAPGELITTTLDGGSYGPASGTSLAAPFVAGAAALLRSQHPGWSPALVRAQLLHTAVDIDALNPSYAGQLGHGRLDLAAAVTNTPVPLITLQQVLVNNQANGTPAPNSTADVAFALYNDWGRATNLQATLTGGGAHVTVLTATVAYDPLDAYQTSAGKGVARISIANAAGFGAALPFTLTLTAAGGYSAAFPVTVTTQSQMVDVSGTLLANTTWTNNHVYHVVDTVAIANGYTLTIEAGTVVMFEADKALYVLGNLVAIGTAEQPIVFTSASNTPAGGDWDRILFAYGSTDTVFDGEFNYVSGSIISHATIEYGGDIYAEDTSLYFGHNEVRNMGGLAGDGPMTVVKDNAFTNAGIWHTGSMQAIGNTITNGGLTLDGAGLVSHNSVAGGSVSIRVADVVSNRFVGQDGEVLINGTGVISGNLIANNTGNGLRVLGWPTVMNNTIVGNGAVVFTEDSVGPSQVHHNNLIAAAGQFAFRNNTASNPSATDNWWGTTSAATINGLIRDGLDQVGYGIVTYNPVLTGPEAAAPAYVTAVDINPDTTLGIQTGTFQVAFSAPMDQSVDPALTFGSAAPYDAFSITDGAVWLDATHWQATFDVTSLVARGVYTVSVSGAVGLDGMMIADDTRTQFTVDYAGTITDQTPPSVSEVVATGSDADASLMQAFWSATNASVGLLSPAADGGVTGYRYAIGSAPGATDVVNWTTTNNAGVTRSLPGLMAGHTYWLSVQARNAGGLWSLVEYAEFIAGYRTLWRVFLPLAGRP
ncbi:MAG: S8 family serine peptidase [Anaerolineales bacterium]|nr:S8 family serine peptidase [Anaerolineales bacterium]